MKIKSALIFIKLSNLNLNFTVFENAENKTNLYIQKTLSQKVLKITNNRF